MMDGKKRQSRKIKTSHKTENWGQRYGTKQKGNFFLKKAENGCLMYAAVMTQLDITFAVSNSSHYLDAPCTTHLHAKTRVFRYLSGTKDYKLVLGGPDTTIVSYSDSDWASQMHRHSISGFAFFIGKGVVSQTSKKQPIITLSSTEAEYVVLTHASKDIIWIQKLLKDFSSIFTLSLPTTLNCDNQGAIHLSKDSTFHGRTKHINIHFYQIGRAHV